VQPSTHAAARPRPQLHFTAQDGWVNDPYGIAWVDDRYHMYFQAVPGQIVWGPNCHWGHATSHDLVHWVEQPVALAPQNYEVGCWSGSVVHTADPPLLFYTRVAGPDYELGQAATAQLHSDGRWHTRPEDVVVDGPPIGMGVRCFRDPNVIKTDDGWVMLMATGLADGVAAVLQYRSADLRNWQYDGVLYSRPNDDRHEVWTGSLWECPQLFRVGDCWVLMVSVWHETTLHYVAAAVGDYNGHTFEPRHWQRLSYGNSAYAMAAFTDREGQPCVMSWLREEPQNNPDLVQWAGAHSVASLVSIADDGSLRLQPHPDVTKLRLEPITGKRDAGAMLYSTGSAAVEISALAAQGLQVVISEAGRTRASLAVNGETLAVTRPGLSQESQPMGTDVVTVLLDADILEIFTPRSYGAYRIAPAEHPAQTRLQVIGTSAAHVRPFAIRSRA
jgi:beta-fructofuranosidase